MPPQAYTQLSCQFFTNVLFPCLKGIESICFVHFFEAHIFMGYHTCEESSRKTSTSALLTMLKPLTMQITKKLWKILKMMGIPDYLTCLLRNLCAHQEAIARTGHGTRDWFQIGKGVHQSYILSPCLFNLYAEYLV